MTNDNIPIIVIGMHRSGTSMLTRFLEESGIFMGEKKGINDESFFFQKINDWILYEASATWDNSYNIKFINNFFIDNISNAINKRLSSIWIKNYLGFNNMLKYKSIKNIDFAWGWKDPRTTLLLPIWKEIFPKAKIIHIYRNPIDVAESLRKRELKLERDYRYTFRKKRLELFLLKKPVYYQSARIHDIYEGVKLWEEYVSLAYTADKYYDDVIHIKYENFLENPELVLHELSKFLDLAVDTELIESISNKVDKTRAYAFTNDHELRNVYSKVKKNTTIKRLGYDDIMAQTTINKEG